MSVTQATFAATLADEWVRSGVTDAVVCPGSRSAPLALALAERAELRVHVRLDERGAGFFALGLAMATGRPPVVCTTSGTAAAELHPAVVEAHYGRVPVIVCTADRPPELQGVGAPQTIDQRGLFGSAVRWSADPGVPVESTRRTWRALAARAVLEASAGPTGPGPVHLNLAFREPLLAEAGPLPAGGADGRPSVRVGTAPGTAPGTVPGTAPGPAAGTAPGPGGATGADAARTWHRRRGVLVAGAGAGPPELVLALAEALGWPLLADPRSGCRTDHPAVVGAADALLRSEAVGTALRPEVAVVLGSPWTSKALGAWLAGAGGEI
ncbi:MAG: 2-succinyl-5-enolpyruvyl-6-hydroxy-3-cyclohexene-1-carboxylic-acid synthase, partial [Acidimicrobiales bacterium]